MKRQDSPRLWAQDQAATLYLRERGYVVLTAEELDAEALEDHRQLALLTKGQPVEHRKPWMTDQLCDSVLELVVLLTQEASNEPG